MRFLAYHNRLDGILPFIAMYWGVWTLLAPQWVVYWPIQTALWHTVLRCISWLLLLAGASQYFASGRGLRWLCKTAVVVKFSAWASMAYALLSATPIAASGVAIYSALALAELLAWSSLNAGIDRCRDG